MNEPDATKPLDNRFIDRIVDGELTSAELRFAVDVLDREPDGWKRCALAFLEAQCWSESTRNLALPTTQPAESKFPPLRTFTPIGKGARRWIRGPIAAGIMTASFALGWASHASRPWPGPERPPLIQADANQNEPASRSTSQKTNPTSVGLAQPTGLAPSRPGVEGAIPTVNEVIRAVGRVRIANEGGKAEVPILAGPEINETWLKSQPPPITEHSLVALRRQGYQVDQRRGLLTKTLADGRRVTIPIGQVQIRFTGNQTL